MWIVEMDCGGINWVPLAYCFSRSQADDMAARPHIAGDGRPVRVREMWKKA